MNQKNTNNSPPKSHHFIRTPIAALLGTVAVILFLSAIMTFWVNRTITNTSSFVGVIGPLAEKTEVQTFIASKAAEAVASNAPIEELAPAVLSQNQLAGKTPDQLKALAQDEIYKRTLTTIKDEEFKKLWSDSSSALHGQFVAQLNSESDEVNLDFNQTVNNVLAQLEKSNIGIKASDLEIKPENTKVTFKKSELGNLASTYESIKNAYLFLLAGAFAAAAGAILISAHHIKTLRRVLVATGIFSLIFFAIFTVPSVVPVPDSNPIDQAAVVAIFEALFQNLRITLLVVGVLAIALGIGSKLFEVYVLRKKTT